MSIPVWVEFLIGLGVIVGGLIVGWRKYEVLELEADWVQVGVGCLWFFAGLLTGLTVISHSLYRLF